MQGQWRRASDDFLKSPPPHCTASSLHRLLIALFLILKERAWMIESLTSHNLSCDVDQIRKDATVTILMPPSFNLKGSRIRQASFLRTKNFSSGIVKFNSWLQVIENYFF